MSLDFLLTSLLWTSLLALCAEGLTRGRTAPQFAQGVWRAAALLMVLPWLGLAFAPFLPSAPLNLPDFPDLVDFGAAADRPAIPTPAESTSTSDQLNISQILLGVLVLGWIVRAGFVLCAHLRLHVLKKTAKHAQNHAFTHISKRWATQLHLKAPPEIALLSGHRSPFVSGLIRQTIYLPKSLKDPLHARPIIAHECTHIARGDLITRPLERAVADLIWFSPFAWLARARLDYWREAVCDTQTVTMTAEPIAYAKALAHVARTARPMPSLPIAALILNKRKTLPMRINSILEPSIKTSRKRLSIGLAALFVATPLALAQGLSEPKSNKTQTFSAPIIETAGAKINSAYGIRKNPFTSENSFHAGTDIGGLPTGTPLAAPAEGTVIFAGTKLADDGTESGYGKAVDLRLNISGYVVRYAQLSEVKVSEGDRVSAGDIVGLLGSSGRSTGPHLHLEYHKDGKPHNPEDIEGLILFQAG